MTDHDELCPQTGTPLPLGVNGCQCYLIAKVRTDERKRIAAAIDAIPMPTRITYRDDPADAWEYGMEQAARIARGGDSDA